MPDIIELSVIVPCHNSRPDYLTRTLEALAQQVLPLNTWELLLIDNASSQQLNEFFPVDWHPHARWIREDELGLTAARLRGIREARGPLLVFVDDDNLLERTYLESALEITAEYPWLGVFGAANIVPEYEVQPAPELKRYIYMLALRNSDRDLLANLPQLTDASPYGAGLCARVEVCRELARRKGGGGVMFDRKGKDLFSSGDLEFSLVASDCGLGQGVFRRLSLTHLIPAQRVSLEYLLRMAEGQSYSNNLLKKLRGRDLGQPPRSVLRDMISVINVAVSTVVSHGIHRRFQWKRGCGNIKALRHFRRIVRENGTR
jgi:glycosyltransferase involved in cell wall biosynthesis